MKLEHYVTSVAAAVEAHEERMSAAFEDYRQRLGDPAIASTVGYDALDARFTAMLAESYLCMQDTITNLRKWPRQ